MKFVYFTQKNGKWDGEIPTRKIIQRFMLNKWQIDRFAVNLPLGLDAYARSLTKCTEWLRKAIVQVERYTRSGTTKPKHSNAQQLEN